MALNEVIYLPNPAGAYTKTVGASVSATGSSTLQAAIAASTYVRARSFCINMSCTGDNVTDLLKGVLKIGGGYYCVDLLTPANANYETTVSSADLGFDGAWLQSGETITFVLSEIGGGTLTNVRANVSVALEDFTA